MMDDILNDKLHEECGVFGMFSHQRDVVQCAYWGLYALQHRGQESCGIAVSDGEQIRVQKDMGLVCDVYKNGFSELGEGFVSIGHVRYSSAKIPKKHHNIHPLCVYYDLAMLALAHNGSITNATELRKRLGAQGALFHTDVDAEVLLVLAGRSCAKNIEDRIVEAVRLLKGAFAMTIMSNHKLMAIRDPYGFRPLCLGRFPRQGGWVVASETCALDQVGAEYVRDLEPGEMIVIESETEEPRSIMYASKQPIRKSHCIFEYVYFARPDSIMDGQSIYMARVNMGRQLARETRDIKADVVISVPDSGTPAAIGYGLESGIPFLEGFTRNKYVGRTFIQPTQKERLDAVKIKLNANRGVLAGKAVVMVDDSIVRGTTSAKLISLLKEAGATAVHVCISSPPVTDPCYYGIDTPEREALIAASKSPEEICELIGADSLHYISMEGMKNALTAMNPEELCCACFNADYPDNAEEVAKEGAQLHLDR